MSIEHRLRSVEKLGRLSTRKERPLTVERTMDGQYYVLARGGRTPIGDEDDFQRWQAAGNRVWAVVTSLTPEGSALVQAIVAGERTNTGSRKE
jgi:hypothetical protein